ncbi:hypothetical protein IFM12275_32510 [Nocardia sputorum]|uniref:Uncharacterized protein n=1 Tax=Nocardia sputorum TaxID=2984338 RepID=A0ABM8D7F9_9NOCA|nr:hypothetical protein IFM12275_32510 [Nocardia sputorum]BDU03404.1 hypothetical protein IFM12276_64320 [Nocardia sputorum]
MSLQVACGGAVFARLRGTVTAGEAKITCLVMVAAQVLNRVVRAGEPEAFRSPVNAEPVGELAGLPRVPLCLYPVYYRVNKLVVSFYRWVVSN